MLKNARTRNRGAHNWIEDLVVGGLVRGHSVPEESGVRFHLGREPSAGLLLVFQTDWQRSADPLFPETVRKADYLCLFIPPDSGAHWIATVVELKGRDGRSQVGGMEQIQLTIQELKAAVKEHCPSRWRVHWQGLLLHAGGAQFDRAAMARASVPIIAVQAFHSVDIAPFVTRRLDRPKVQGVQGGDTYRRAPTELESAFFDGPLASPAPPTESGLRIECPAFKLVVGAGSKQAEITGDSPAADELRAHCP